MFLVLFNLLFWCQGSLFYLILAKKTKRLKMKYVRSMSINWQLFAFKRVAAQLLGQIERVAERLNKVSGRWTYNCTSIECCNIVTWALGQNVRRCHGNRDASPSRWAALSSHTARRFVLVHTMACIYIDNNISRNFPWRFQCGFDKDLGTVKVNRNLCASAIVP